MLLAGQGGDHLTSSAIYHSSTVTCIPNTLIGSTVCSTMANASCIGIGTTSPSTTLDVNGTGRFGSAATKLTTYSDSAYSGIFNGASLGSNESIYMGDARMFFFASGSERMRLTSTGLGIGTTSPDIFGRGDGFDVGISSACVGSTQNMSLQLNAGATAGRGAQLYMGQGGTRHFTISSNVTETSIGTTSNTPLRFVTCDSLERLRFTNTGIACFACQVCAPSSIIKGTINEQLVLDFVIGAGSYTHQSFRLCGANQYRLIGNTNGNFVLRNDVISSDVLTFACAGGATFACSVIAGNVFASYSGTNAGVEFGNSGSGGQFGFLKWDNGSNYLYLGHSYGSAFNRNLVINSSGNVGIGTATIPSDRILQIHSSCAYARMALTNTSTGVAGGDGLIFQMENCFAIIKNQETSCLVLGTNGRETDIVINQNGNVGIGQIPINKFTILAGNSNVLDLFDTGAGFGIGMQAMNSAATVFRSWDFYASKYQFFNGNAIFSGGNSADVNNTPIRVPNNKFLTFYNAADTGWAFTMGANSDNSGGIGGLQGINFNTGASLAQRMTITSTGISCFACQVCVPGLSITSISGLSMNNGISARQTTSRKLMFTNWNVGDSNAIKLLNISLNTNTKIIGDITIYKGARTSNHAFVGKAFIWASNAGSFAASAVCLFNPTSTFNGGDSYLGNIWWCTQTSDLYYCVSTEANYEFIGFEINTVGADSPTITYAF
jgi:hypothetical protein